jgi:pimeloyl-ACP methyl ester carboxylesterase
MFAFNRSTLTKLGLAASAVVFAGAAVTTAQTMSASAAPKTTDTSVLKPTIVIEHGAWADGSSFASVVRQLQHQGYTVDVPPNPLRGLANDSATLADFIQKVNGPIVLVGHSYGGAVITDAATGNSQVKALVYVDAYVPAEGESLLQLTSAQPGSYLGGNPFDVFNMVSYPGAPTGDPDLYVQVDANPDFPGFASTFANDLSPSEGAVLAATQRPALFSVLTDQSTAPAWTTIPSWDLVGTADHVIPPAEQLFMAQRAHAHIVTVDSSHLSMISHPEAVTNLIVTAAQATS